MSRIGNQPVPLPAGVRATVADGSIEIAGPLGKLAQTLARALRVTVDEAGKQIRVERANELRQTKALHGLARALIANMVVGVTRGYTKSLQVVGVGYSAKLQGKDLVLQLGYANPVVVPIPEGIQVAPPVASSMLIIGVGSVPCTTVRLSGMDKQLVGEIAARIRRIKPPDPYKAKGVRYEGEEIKRKAGKAFGAQE
jgi:large subunit ribosomal protein L6